MVNPKNTHTSPLYRLCRKYLGTRTHIHTKTHTHTNIHMNSITIKEAGINLKEKRMGIWECFGGEKSRENVIVIL